jgi:hypothetical protein
MAKWQVSAYSKRLTRTGIEFGIQQCDGAALSRKTFPQKLQMRCELQAQVKTLACPSATKN